MSAEAHDNRRPAGADVAPLARITHGEHAGRVGRLWRNSGAYQVEVDLGPAGGVVTVPASWVEDADSSPDGWDDGTVGDAPR